MRAKRTSALGFRIRQDTEGRLRNLSRSGFFAYILLIMSRLVFPTFVL